MRLRKILVPIDFSPAGEEAVEVAASLARDNGGKLLIIHAEEPPIAYGGGEMYASSEPDRAELRKRLREVVPTVQVLCTHKLVEGDPAEAIIQIAELENIDLIVMSTHGRTGLTRLLMGSVAEAVVRRAPCPVLTVKQPAAVPAEAL
jgi:nucleotide-binding universal stress UspA family protein